MTNNISKPTFSDYIYILVKWKKFILINLIIVVLVTTGLSFLIPKTFKGTSVVMITPESTMGIGGLTGLLGGKSSAQSLGSKLFGGSSSSEDMLLGILNSKTAILNVVEKFDLFNYYQVKDENKDQVLKAFVNDLSFDLTENGFIEISVINENANKSADIANYFVYLLDSLNIRINSEAAKNSRLFIEKRYLKNIDDLKNAEDSLFKFQKRYGVIAIPEQLELSYKAAAEIESQLFQKQLASQFILGQYGENSPQYSAATTELDFINKKINELKTSSDISKKSNVLLPFKEFPNLSINYLRIYREVEIQSKILEVILPMYEQAKVEELKSIPSVIVIDKATPPSLKYRPQKSFIILSVLFLVLFFLIPLVYRMESILRKDILRNPLEENESQLYKSFCRFYKIKY